jgi:hypothetical protein
MTATADIRPSVKGGTGDGASHPYGMVAGDRPTSWPFAGDRLDTLFVTGMSVGLSHQQRIAPPFAGGVFALDVGAGARRSPASAAGTRDQPRPAHRFHPTTG